MWSPFNEYPVEFDRFKNATSDILKEAESNGVLSENSHRSINEKYRKKKFILPEVVFQPYETIFMTKTVVKVDDSIIGSIAADNLTGCPPAISPVIAGEKISKDIVDIMRFYDVEEIGVISIGE